MTRLYFAALLAGAFLSHAQELPGRQSGGSVLLPSGWKIKPAGEQVTVDTLPLRAAPSKDGRFLLVLNGGSNPPSISVIDIAARRELSRTPLPDAWLGLTLSPAGDFAYVGGGSSGKVFELSLTPDGKLARTREFEVARSTAPGAPFVGDVALSPDGRVLYAADLYGDSIAQINLQSGKMVDHWKTGRRPYRLLLSPDGAHLLITSWAEGAVYEHESGTGILVTKLRVGPHPTDILWLNKRVIGQNGGPTYTARVFVATANTNSVATLGVTADGQLTPAEPLSVSSTPMHPLGMTPSALVVDKSGSRLYIACSDANVVAVADISTTQPQLFGFIPAGAYPTALTVLPDDALAIVNGKGNGLSPAGTVQLLPLRLSPSSGVENLNAWTATVTANSPYRDDLIYGPVRNPQEAFFSKLQEHPSPLQHVIYLLRPGGDQPPRPNLRALSQQFIDYQNFYTNADNAIEGQNWLAAAIAPDYTVKLAPSVTAGRSKVRDFEGGELANSPPAGYLWNNAQQAGVTFRNYGEWVSSASAVTDLSLAPYTDKSFRGPDPSYRDIDRAREFIREWKQFESAGQTPQLSIVRLSSSDNDAAIGAIVDAISHSKLWSSTAIFVVDAAPTQAASHRAHCLVISPFTHRGTSDPNLYTQASVLRTIELILGLRPMTQFDAAARPLFDGFARQVDSQPFSAVGTP